MSEMTSFTSLTQTAFKDVIRDRLTWWMALPIGALIVASSFFVTKAGALLPGKDATLVTMWLTEWPDTWFLLFFGLSLVLTLIQSPLRGITILLLQSAHINQSSEKPFQLKRKDFFRVARVAFVFESGLWLVLIGIGLILFMPSLLAWTFNRHAFAFVSEIALLLLLGLFLYLYLIKELALFYGLLGNTSFRSAIDLGFRIFRRHSFLTLLFFTYLSMLALIGTLAIDTFARTLSLPFPNEYHAVLRALIALPCFGLYFIFDQALRLTYFRNIASPPKTPAAKVVVTKPVEPVTGMTNV